MANKISTKKVSLTAAASLLVSNTIFNSIEPRIRSSFSVFSGLLLITFSQGNSTPISFGLGLIAGGALDSANTALGGTIIKNKFKGIIWYKDEHSENVYPLKPYETIGIIKKIDGIASPFKPNAVFKIPNGCVVIIKENGDVELTNISKIVISKLNKKSGWRDKSFVLENPEWRKLFEKSLQHG